MAFTLWISLGQNFSTTLVKQPWLPLNPVDQCSIKQLQQFKSNDTIFNLIGNSSQWSSNDTKIPLMDNYDKIISDYWDWKPYGHFYFIHTLQKIFF